MKTDLSLAIRQLASERGLPQDIVLEALEAALVAAYRKSPKAWAQNVDVVIEPDTGDTRVYAELAVVEDVQDRRSQIALKEAWRVDPDAEIGHTVKLDVTPKDFGRIAAQTAKQVILQRIREAEREATYHTYADREGEIVQGTVQSINSQGITVALDKAEAHLPRANQMPNEHYDRGQRIRIYVQEVRRTPKGPEIVVSRTHKNMLRRLMEVEVPEIFNGSVEIKAIAREAGSRSKVAVAARQEGVDPVGACVGIRGVRIQALVNELNGEKIDVVAWDPDPTVFIANALSPAQVTNVRLVDMPEGRTAEVVVPDRQLSLAIGKEGQNARLAAKLTGWRIDIRSESEAADEAARRAEEEARQAQELKELEAARALLAAAEAGEATPATISELEEEIETLEEQLGPEAVAQLEAADRKEELGVKAEPQFKAETTPEAEEAPAPAEVGHEVQAGPEQAGMEEHEAAEVPASKKLQEEVGEKPVAAEDFEALFVVEEGEKEEDVERDRKGRKKKRKQRRLVFDEELGEVVARKQRKPGRRRQRWEEEVERWELGDFEDEEED